MSSDDPEKKWLLLRNTGRQLSKPHYNKSIVIGRTAAEGTILRKVDSLELVRASMKMPIGAIAWQENYWKIIDGDRKNLRGWHYIVDGGNPTFRHSQFAIPQVTDKRCFDRGDVLGTTLLGRIGTVINSSSKDQYFVIPRECAPPEFLLNFDPSITWCIDSNQDALDSHERVISHEVGKYDAMRPRITSEAVIGSTTAFCSHREDALSTWNGVVKLEKNAKIAIGNWYTCEYNPRMASKNLAVCRSIRLLRPDPLPTFKQTYIDSSGFERTLVLCREFLSVPAEVINGFGETELYSCHKLLQHIYFPLYCRFSNMDVVEVCFARKQFDLDDDKNRFEVVAVNNGMGMYWLPELLSPEMESIINKVAFPFIRSIDDMEEEHYSQFSKSPFAMYMKERIDQFKTFKEPKRVVMPTHTFSNTDDFDCIDS